VRRLLLATLVLFISSPAWATISRVQSKANFTGSGSTCAATFTTNPAVHDLVVVWTSWKPSTVTASVGDSEGNTYSNAIGPTTQARSGVNSQIFYAKNVAGRSSDTVTVTYSASTTTCTVVIVEYNGPDQNSPLDVTSASTGTGTTLDSNIATPEFVNELVFGAGSVDTGTASAGTGFSSIRTSGGSITEDNILVSNAQQHATGASSSGNWVMQFATFRETAATLSRSVGIAGPRPYVDVTAHGAKGINTDDTAAIQDAITAACAATIGGNSAIPQVYFPPGYYGVQQPQTPSTASPLVVPCPVEFLGGGGVDTQFATQPTPDILAIYGSSPNAAPLFSVTGVGVTFNHLLITGYNQAVQLKQTSNIRFQDTFLGAAVTGDADNSPLVEINSLWTFFRGGGFGFNNANPSTFKNLYDVEFLGETNSSGDICYLQFFTDVTGSGGGFLYDQRAPPINGIPNQFVFRNINIEGGANSFFTVITSTANPSSIAAVTFDHDVIDDSLATTPIGIFNMDQAGGGASGIIVNQSGGTNYAVLRTLGTVNTYSIQGCSVNCSNQAVDANLNPLGSGYAQTAGGLDFVSNLNDPNRLVNIFNQPAQSQPDGLAIRVFPNGSGGFATSGLDGSLGWLFGNGASNGWTAQVVQSTQNSLDIGFSTTLPPTGVTASIASGGTLANGTYYYFVSPAFGGGSCAEASVGAPSLVSSAATTTTGNNQVNLSWTLPPTAPAKLTGFCVFRSAIPTYIGAVAQFGIYVSGSTSTSVTDTGSNFSSVGSGVEFNHMQAFHRFTPTSLGIGTLNPLFNADIRGSIGGATYNTQTNCSSSASPAPCVSASAGSVTVAASATTEVVNTTAITANSQVLLTFDSSLGTRLGVTCNTTAVQGAISARTAGTSFTIKVPTAPSTDPACFSYEIVN
jgi:hypothetical protein